MDVQETAAIHSAQQQDARRARVHALCRAAAFDLYDDAGRCLLAGQVDWRDHLWQSMALLTGDERHIRRANGMLRHIADQGGSDFWSSAAAMILARHSERLLPDVRAALRRRLEGFLDHCAPARFHGYNDNFPAMAALSVLVGAPLLGRPEYLPRGREILQSLRRMLLRRGFISEYTSPNYSPITLACLAEIVNLSPCPEARDLALAGEARLWFELASHLHAPTSLLAGPYSRAYLANLCGHFSHIHAVLYQVFGDGVFINVPAALLPLAEGQVGQPRVPSDHVPWLTTPTYHVPDAAADLALRKRWPCTIRASAEQGAFPRNWSKPQRHPATPTMELPACHTHLHTFMTEDFAVGTADRPFLDGPQHAPFHVVYRRRRPATGIRDVATLFSRFLHDEAAPPTDRHINDQGRACTVAHQGAALVLYHGRPAWTHGRLSEQTEGDVVHTACLKLALVVSCFWDRPQEVWLGDQARPDWSGASAEPCSVFFRDGPLYVALHPLLHTNHGRTHAVRLEEGNGLALVSLVNYQGPRRAFAPVELMLTWNGFVAEIDGAGQWGSFADFRAAHARPRITDACRPYTGMREVRYERAGLALALAVSPVSDGIRYRTVNDGLAPEPRLEITGFDPAGLPWW